MLVANLLSNGVTGQWATKVKGQITVKGSNKCQKGSRGQALLLLVSDEPDIARKMLNVM